MMVFDSRWHEPSFVEVSAGGHHTAARRSDGSVIAVMISGLSNVSSATAPLPLNLTPLGLTNCWLRVRSDANDVLFGSAGSANYALVVPASTALAGLLLHQQALVLDPAAGVPLGLVMSDAATAVVGS